MMPLSVLFLSSSVLPTAYYDIYENVNKISYYIYKEIHMNILYMMTKTCKYINFYRVNMNYLQSDIYIYFPELYIHTVISCSTEPVPVHSLSSSVLPAAYYDICENVK